MHNNFQINFSLKGFTSILIGAYIFIAGYLINAILNGFLIDDHIMGMMSAQIIEFLIIGISILVFILSSFALFFKGKRKAKRFQHKLWNGKTKSAFWKYIILVFVVFASLLVLNNLGYIDYITPTFLILYGVLLFLFKNNKRKNILIVSGLCLLLAALCILIPTYWYSSLSILGIAHITYGVVIRN